MVTMEVVERLALKYQVPIEDALFIALNVNGVRYECEYNRMRTAFRLADNRLFDYAKDRGELDYYFALPVNPASPFSLTHNVVRLADVVIGEAIGATEDICDSHYPRRNGTSLNINPNSRTSCRGCACCYTAYQVPCDRKKLKTETDLRDFFEEWMMSHGLTNLAHLIQISVVTGCYDDSAEVCSFLRALRKIASEYLFIGRIFYLGSQITTQDSMQSIQDLQPLGICISLETFERRELLRDKKRSLTLQDACDALDVATNLGFEANFAYIVGMESLRVLQYHFRCFKDHVNKFPTINTLQLHKYHDLVLRDPSAHRLEYYLEARQILEEIFSSSGLRPLVWEDYRSLWFLKFGNEPLNGIRVP